MKKIILVMTIVLLAMAICSCGPATAEEACEKADKMLEKWTKEEFAGCSYSGEYIWVQNDWYYVVYAKLPSSATYSDYLEYIVTYTAQDINETIYPELNDLLSEFDVPVLITITNSTKGTTYAGILDGEISYFD